MRNSLQEKLRDTADDIANNLRRVLNYNMSGSDQRTVEILMQASQALKDLSTVEVQTRADR